MSPSQIAILAVASVSLLTGPRVGAQPSERRERLYDKLGGGIALLLAEADFSTNWQPHRYDPGYFVGEFKQEVHFHYLTGLGASESNAVLFVDGATRASDLYMLQVSEEKKRDLLSAGFRSVKARSELVSDLGALAGRKLPVYLLLGREDFLPFPKVKIFPEGLDEPTDRQRDFQVSLSRRFDWMEFRNLDPILTGMRAVKDAQEIATIRRAVEISSLSLLETLRSVRAGVWESQLAGVARFACRVNGAQRAAYSEDLQSGPNFMKSFIELFNHYDKLDRVMQAGEVMLVDLSCEHDYFKTDLARTAPVSGTFSKEQRALYDLYLVAYRAALATIRPGVTQRDIALASVEAMKKELPKLGSEYLRQGAESYIKRHESGAPRALRGLLHRGSGRPLEASRSRSGLRDRARHGPSRFEQLPGDARGHDPRDRERLRSPVSDPSHGSGGDREGHRRARTPRRALIDASVGAEGVGNGCDNTG